MTTPSTVKPLSLGVVGAGNMGSRYIRIISESPLLHLAGIAETNTDLAHETGRLWNTNVFPSVEELVQVSGLEGLVIATPDADHLHPALCGARAGKHLFIEKPLATTLHDGREIIRAAKEASVVLLVGHTLRYDPRYAAAREAIRAGRIGKLVHISNRRNTYFGLVRHYGARVSIAMFLGVHDVDYLLWTLEAKPMEVYAVSTRGCLQSEGIDLDDTTFSLIRFEDGLVASLENSWCGHDSPGRRFNQTFEAVGSQGEIQIVADDTGLLIRGLTFADHPNAVYSPIVNDRLAGTYAAEIQHFFECIRFEATPLSGGESSLAAVQVVLAIHESLRTGTPAPIHLE